METKFPFNKLPIDIQAEILSSLDIFELQYYSNVFSYELIYHTLKMKFRGIDDNKVIGTINNFSKCCYLCNTMLLDIYNLLICSECCLEFNSEQVYYPEFCQACSGIKIKRGAIKLSNCIICNKYSTYLGISLFS